MRWSQLQQPPPRTLELQPSAFASTWGARPAAPISVGIRSIPLIDIEEARSDAAREALSLDTSLSSTVSIEAYNDAVLAWIVSRCTCEPADVSTDWKLLGDVPLEGAKNHLSVTGARAIFDAYERLSIDQDPTQLEATDDEIVRLPEAYADAVRHLHGARLTRVRRLLRFVLDELADVTPAFDDEPETDDDE